MRDKRKNNNNSTKIERENMSKRGNRRCLMMVASGKITKGGGLR